MTEAWKKTKMLKQIEAERWIFVLNTWWNWGDETEQYTFTNDTIGKKNLNKMMHKFLDSGWNVSVKKVKK